MAGYLCCMAKTTAPQLELPLQEFAVLDIETTGTQGNGGITEIAIIIHDGVSEKSRFVTLINPERKIDPFVARLTGITDALVANAPKFHEVAKQILETIGDRVIVAHNASFDYGFLKAMYRSLGFRFERDTLCTIEVARDIFPGHKSYGLKNITRDLGIPLPRHHRALGDTEATAKLLELLYANDAGKLFKRIKPDLPEVRIPPNLPPDQLKDLPEEVGVYYFHDADGNMLYVGKSIDIRKRVLQHFHPTEKRKWAELWKKVHSISYSFTGSELIALLLETAEIKLHQPPLNQANKRPHFPYGIFYSMAENGYAQFTIGRNTPTAEPLVEMRSYMDCKRLLLKKAEELKLCPCLMGIDRNERSCFNFQVHLCSGAGVGHEGPPDYNQRAEKLRTSLSFPYANAVIIGRGRNADERSVIHIAEGVYRGFGFVPYEMSSISLMDLIEDIRPQKDDPDIRKIIHGFLRKDREHKIVEYVLTDDGEARPLAKPIAKRS